ncbi:MAG: hypothetical protein ACM3SQ_06575 [Betaproteobacteria bacterium]
MFELAQLSDNDLRAALFDALVERLDAKAHEDPSIALVNRMPTVFAVSRHGNLLTLSQGLGPRLLRGDLKWKDRHEKLRTFNVGRAAIQSRLAITPDGIEGTPDEILDSILAMFLEWTAAGEETRPPVAEPVPESRPTARVPQDRPRVREAMPERRAAPAAPTQGRRPAAPAPPRIPREGRPAPVDVARPTSVEVTVERPPAPPVAAKPSDAEARPPGPVPGREVTTPALRTYQMLFETARRELDQAKKSPADGRYFLISAGVFVALTAEAFFNDLGSRVIPSWSQLQRLDPREKAEVLNIELFNEKVDWSVRPFQSVAAALGFRRALAHAHAETLSFDQAQTADLRNSEVPRTRRTVWQEHCDVATIQGWITDLRLVIEHFSRAHDPAEASAGTVERPSASSSASAGTRKKFRPGDRRQLD